MIGVAPGKTVSAITLKLVYKVNGDTQEVYDMPAETTKAVNDFVVPRRYRRERARDAPFMYSLGVYCEPADTDNLAGVYYCLASRTCRPEKRTISCPRR